MISVEQLVSKGVKLVLGESEAYFEKGNTRINLEQVDGLWAVPEVTSSGTVATLRINEKADAKIWHQRLGHVGNRKIEKLVKDSLIPTNAKNYESKNCNVCCRSFPGRRPVPKTSERSGYVTIQVDYVPMGKEERGWKGEVGAYVYTSRASKLVKAYPVKDASTASAAETLDMYCNDILPNLKENANCMQMDAGTQFITDKWNNVCKKYNIRHRTCPVDHQAMNGQAERVIGILMSKTRALLMDKGVKRNLWPLALETATFLYNRIPNDSLRGTTPLKKATGQDPDLERLRVFGCRAFIQIPKPQRKGKLSDTAWQGVMVGYSTNSPEWIILDPRSGKLRKGYSAKFN